MTTLPRRRFWLKLAAGLLFAALAFLAYGWAYIAWYHRVPAFRLTSDPEGARTYLRNGFEARYHGPNIVVNPELFFRLAHGIDRQLRREYWEGAQ